MIALIQKVHECALSVENNLISEIKNGLVITIGVFREDEKTDALKLAKKIVNMRLFKDDNNKINLNVLNVKGEILVVSNFTLCAEIKSGTRPNFSHAKNPQQAEELYVYFKNCLNELGVETVKLGAFGQHMHLKTVIDGPFNIVLNSKEI